ncbi:MAG TPA: DUF1343 domain-containing protein [Chitinophagaceae bacterium]|nr:DUF1343 domain-containing protein [Chitinophagaceae bacterium]
MLTLLRITLLAAIVTCSFACPAQPHDTVLNEPAEWPRPIIAGAERIDKYLPLLKDKRVGIFANHTSMVGRSHVVDTLVKLGVNIKVIFAPEHGFRGTADAGEKIPNATDPATGIPVISLYGSKRKPSAEDLKDVDIMLFDIQDVGVRFYTYISSLEEYMDAAFSNGNKPVMVLDRPNPNGFYVDGPVLDTAFRSFVGMQPVAVVYGMTIGEYAKMLVGERWLPSLKHQYKTVVPKLIVIPCANYTHKSRYELPVRPSPNLPEIQSIYWYPSTCYFEGTALSEGRGTDKPFQVFGHPSLPNNLYSFTPTSREGAKSPKLLGQVCYGWNLSGTKEEVLDKSGKRIQLSYLLNAYKLFPDKSKFFITSKANPGPADYFFNKLAGNATLMQQIIEGKTELDIRKSWEPGLNAFKIIRKRYLLYEDF